MSTSFLIHILLFFKNKEVINMLVRLYASEIALGRITIDDVPARLKPQVEAYLNEVVYM